MIESSKWSTGCELNSPASAIDSPENSRTIDFAETDFNGLAVNSSYVVLSSGLSAVPINLCADKGAYQ